MATEEPCASPTLAPEEPPASTTLATKEPPASPTLAPEKPPASTTLAPEEPSASPTLATAEPPASPTLAIEEPPASPEQELSDCVTNTSSSAYSCGTSSSSVRSGSPEFKGSLFGDTPSAQVSWAEEEEEEEEDLSPEEDTIMVIQQHLQGRAEALHNRYSRSLDTILRGRLTETPTMEKLQHLLEHIHLSLQSKNTQERARAVQTSAALLQFATSLPGFDVFGEIFTEDQKSSFLQAGLLAIHHPLLRVSQAGLVLTYSIVGEASQLLEDEVTKEGSPGERPPGPFTSRPLKITPIPSPCADQGARRG
ncbi:uncharacterized protein LOC120383303 isoform X3 [Mauremys reevesii]|uniref:uncharacterized protein LOC120383303 isoform X3 n=1 Tax=Mauremys reevesii TaxID=260615 RepID=UPI00193FDA8C|nr:uncharacterized protein LOC120383303 isoform X3 [Mauremys reevesii]